MGLVFHNGFGYEENLSESEISELIKYMKNTLDRLNEVNLYAKKKNEDRYIENFNAHSEKKPKIKKAKEGHIYIVFCNRSKLYKIGMTCTNPTERFKQLKISNPDIQQHSTFKTDDVVSTESWLHYVYSDKRVSGEWFELNESDLERIKEILTTEEYDLLSNH